MKKSEEVCKVGRQVLGTEPRIRFQSVLPDQGHFDIVHCGSSIEYVDDWLGTLALLAGYAPAWMIFVNLPAADNKTFVTTQNYHGKRIPVRFWSFADFVSSVQALGYELVFKSRFRGSWREAFARMPTGHFEPAYRAEYFCQLAFRSMIGVRSDQT